MNSSFKFQHATKNELSPASSCRRSSQLLGDYLKNLEFVLINKEFPPYNPDVAFTTQQYDHRHHTVAFPNWKLQDSLAEGAKEYSTNIFIRNLPCTETLHPKNAYKFRRLRVEGQNQNSFAALGDESADSNVPMIPPTPLRNETCRIRKRDLLRADHERQILQTIDDEGAPPEGIAFNEIHGENMVRSWAKKNAVENKLGKERLIRSIKDGSHRNMQFLRRQTKKPVTDSVLTALISARRSINEDQGKNKGKGKVKASQDDDPDSVFLSDSDFEEIVIPEIREAQELHVLLSEEVAGRIMVNRPKPALTYLRRNTCGAQDRGPPMYREDARRPPIKDSVSSEDTVASADVECDCGDESSSNADGQALCAAQNTNVSSTSRLRLWVRRVFSHNTNSQPNDTKTDDPTRPNGVTSSQQTRVDELEPVSESSNKISVVVSVVEMPGSNNGPDNEHGELLEGRQKEGAGNSKNFGKCWILPKWWQFTRWVVC